jgi:hypothetical protein
MSDSSRVEGHDLSASAAAAAGAVACVVGLVPELQQTAFALASGALVLAIVSIESRGVSRRALVGACLGIAALVAVVVTQVLGV